MLLVHFLMGHPMMIIRCQFINFIYFLIQEHMSEVWSKPVAQFKGGRRGVTALHGNSSGKENAYGCITVAERLTFRLHGFFCKLN